jgi:hypothetical protein
MSWFRTVGWDPVGLCRILVVNSNLSRAVIVGWSADDEPRPAVRRAEDT